MKTSNAEQVIKEFKKFEDMQNEYSNFGAEDTEPDTKYEFAIADYLKAKWDILPKGAKSWQLYSRMDGVEKVADKFTHQLAQIRDTMFVLPMGELEKVKEYVEKNYWRINL